MDKQNEQYNEKVEAVNSEYKEKVSEAEAEYDATIQELKSTYQATVSELESKLEASDKEVSTANDTLEQVNQDLEKAQIQDSNTISNEAKKNEIVNVQEQILDIDIEEKEKRVNVINELIKQEGKIYSDYSGTVTEIELIVGKASTSHEVIKIACGNKFFQCEVEKDKAKHLNENDIGEIEINGESQRLKGEITSIDLVSKEDQAIVFVEVNEETENEQADILVGVTGIFYITKPTQAYDTCVPIQGIYSDSKQISLLHH